MNDQPFFKTLSSLTYHKQVIGVTGHRDLLDEDLDYIRHGVRQKLKDLIGDSPEGFTLLSGLAQGADQLVAQEAINQGIALVVLLPQPIEEYIQNDFDADSLEAFRRLQEQAIATIVCEPLPNSNIFEVLGQYLAGYSDHLLALWNGVTTGNTGGTAHVVEMMVAGKNNRGQPLPRRGCRQSPQVLHQLVTPRQSNRFAFGRRFDTSGRGESSLSGAFWWVVTSLPLDTTKPTKQQFGSWFRKQANAIFKFWVPAALAVLTALIGTWGLLTFNELCMLSDSSLEPLDIDDAFFKAFKFNTLESALGHKCHENIPLILNIARGTGALFFFWSAVQIVLGFFGDQRRYFWLWIWQRFTNFYLVLGLNERSYRLVLDLCHEGKRVVIADTKDESIFLDECRKRGAIFFSGDLSSLRFLHKIYAHRAKQIYLLSEQDEINTRIVQQLDQSFRQLTTNQQSASDWFVQIEELRQGNFLHYSVDKQHTRNIYITNIFENIARRQLLYYPIDRFQTNRSQTAQVVIFGFGKVGQAIALACCQVGHFPKDYDLSISVYTSNSKQVAHGWFAKYPCLDRQSSLYNSGMAKEVRDYTFSRVRIQFNELPQSDSYLLNDSLLTNFIKPENVLSMYFCMDNSLSSAAYLTSLLPRLEYHPDRNQCDIQTFCYYNFPDKQETSFTEANLNAIASNIPVLFFGNLAEECSQEAICNRYLDEIPQYINGHYSKLNDKQTIKVVWQKLSEPLKESNRQAADHLWIKLRAVSREQNITDWSHLKQYFAQTRNLLNILQTNTSFTHSPPEAIYHLAEVEHRRWCAEKLLTGMMPLQDSVFFTQHSTSDWVKLWKGDYKESFQAQKLHLDLVPFSYLEQMTTTDEIQKDINQINGIELFMNVLEEPREKH